MYSDISACVRLSTLGSLTDNFECNRGLRQGDSLSAVLFICFINDLENFFVSNECNQLNLDTMPVLVILLADDMTMFDKSIKGLQRKLNLLELQNL